MSVQNQTQYTSLADLANDIQAVVNVYQKRVLVSIQSNIDHCGEIFIDEVKKISPPKDNKGIYGHYRDSWGMKKPKKAKYVVYVGNTKKVKRNKKEKEPAIPLINILEFSKVVYKSGAKKAKPHVGDAVKNSKDQIINTIADAIEKES